MKNLISRALLVLVCVWASIAQAEGRRDCDIKEVPIPFKYANLKVELSSGEYYYLLGRVRILADVPFLEIDLDRHGWLASDTRMRNPYYVLMGAPEEWANYRDQYVQVSVQAHGQVFQKKGKLFYGIWLQSLMEPERKIPRNDPSCR